MIIDGLAYKDLDVESKPDLGSWKCAKREKSDITGTETETDKIPDIKALQTMESLIDTKIDEAKKAEEISYQNTSYPAQTNVKKALDAIWAKLDYVKPEISSFTSRYKRNFDFTKCRLSYTLLFCRWL